MSSRQSRRRPTSYDDAPTPGRWLAPSRSRSAATPASRAAVGGVAVGRRDRLPGPRDRRRRGGSTGRWSLVMGAHRGRVPRRRSSTPGRRCSSSTRRASGSGSGRTWHGLPWGALERVEHDPRRGLLRDGRLILVAAQRRPGARRAGRGGRRQTRWSRRLYGAPFAVPLGLSTRVSDAGDDLTAALEPAGRRDPGRRGRARAGRRGRRASTSRDRRASRSRRADAPQRRCCTTRGRRWPAASASWPTGCACAEAGRRARRRPHRGADDTTLPLVAAATPIPLRDPVDRRPRRGAAATVADDDDRRVRAAASCAAPAASTWSRTPRRGATRGPPDRHAPATRSSRCSSTTFAVEPAADPVVGPELAAARTRLGLTVDQLAERTRIRPHVIESIEVDDFAPCGGDFYARGHLRTLARVLGVDAAPLLASYDERYADAPIDARRVFEAELATGADGSIRGTRGGPNWSVLVAAVMALVLAWSIARLIMDSPIELRRPAGPQRLAVRPRRQASARRSRCCWTRPAGGAHVVVRDGAGKVVFNGDLAYGETRTRQGRRRRCWCSPRTARSRSPSTAQDRGPLGDRGPARARTRSRRRSSAASARSTRAGSSRHTRSVMTSETDTAPARDLLSVAMVTLGCARNEVDSEELAGRLEADGFRLVEDPADADTVVVNTCGFVESAKKDSVDTLLAGRRPQGDAAAPQAVVAVGCLAERYGKELAESLPEADAVLGFDDYPDIAARLRSIVAGEAHHAAHAAGPAQAAADLAGRAVAVDRARCPATPSGPASRAPPASSRGPDRPPLKLASGCDRRCSFCAIPRFRGSFVSRRPVRRAAGGALARRPGRPRAVPGQRELHVLRQGPRRPPAARDAAARAGRRRRASSGSGSPTCSPPRPAPAWSRRSRRRPAWRRTSTCPSSTPAGPVLRRMRRFGDPESFLGAARRRSAASRPRPASARNVIVGFPGETEDDLETLCDFLVAARLDVTGVFGYSDEDGTEAATYDGKLDEDEIRARAEHVTGAGRGARPRSAPRTGSASSVEVLVERVDGRRGRGPGRAPGPRGRRRHDAASWHGGVAVGDLVPRGRGRHRGRRPGRRGAR